MPDLPFSPTIPAAAMLLALLLVSADVRAELGGTMSTGPGAAGAAPQTLLNGALRVRTQVDAGNTTINEYATSAGEIIAYTWQGPTMPDMDALLGKYGASYRAGAAASPATGNLHALRVVRPDVIVESGGPMRGYAGRAWLPANVPSGVTSADFR